MATSIVDQSAYLGKPKNVNVGRNIKEFGAPVAIIGLPPGTVLDSTKRADLKTALAAMAVNDNPYARLYALNGITGWEEANGDTKSETTGNGMTRYISDGKTTITMHFEGKGFDFHRILRSFTNSQRFLEYLIYHETGELGGVRVINADGSYDLKGIKFFQLYTAGRKFATPSAGEKPMLMATLDNMRQINEDYAYIDTDFDVQSVLAGITDVHLEVFSISTTKYGVRVLSGYTKQDFSAMFATEMTAGTTSVVVKNITAGTTLSVTGIVAKVGYFEVTLSAAPTAGNKLRFQLPAPSVLNGLGISWFESDYAEIAAI